LITTNARNTHVSENMAVDDRQIVSRADIAQEHARLFGPKAWNVLDKVCA
jgi:hypothetical protein